MTAKFFAVPAIALSVAAGLSGAALGRTAPAPAKTTVTIQAEGTDMSGVVKSSRPGKCAKNRQVTVVKQIGARGGGDDENFASDTASRQAGAYRWSTGNTGTEGRFYARVRRIEGCAGDTSETIRVQRND